MRKGMISPGVLLTGIILFSIILMYGERGPEGRFPSVAIPEPSDGTLFLYFEERSGSWLSALPGSLRHFGVFSSETEEAFRLLKPLFEMAGESAVMVAWEENAVHFYIGTKFPGEIKNALAEGAFPKGNLSNSKKVELEELHPGTFVLVRNGEMLPLYLCISDGIALFASTKDKIQRMLLTLEKQAESITSEWKIERRWPNHLLFSDGGLFSGIAAMEGLPAAKGNLLVSAAWREESFGGRMKWKVYGFDDIFPPSFLEELRAVRWGDRLAFPEPLFAAAGFNIPGDASSLVARDLPDQWRDEEYFVERILPGPSILSLCGSSKFLVFTLPGILLQLPDRGKRGEEYAEAFWKKEWAVLVPGVEQLDGFPAGGTTAIPFSILSAANFRMLQIGLIDRDALRPERFRSIREYSPALRNIGNAFAWAYFDMPKIGASLHSLSKTGRIAERMGRTLKMSPHTLLRAASALERFGRISLVMPLANEGFLEWRVSAD